MSFLAIPFPAIDPVLVEVGPIAIRWYALSYIFGIMLGWWLVGKLNRRQQPPVMEQRPFDDLVIWAAAGILLGGRLGYILFYNSGHYFSHPSQIMAVWQGGMSFHGGLLGVIISMAIFCRWHKIQFFRLMDMMACATPIGLFLGRLANFVNGELYGRIASPDLPWAVIFPGDAFARHPSQLYEAVLEGVVLFIILNLLAFRTKALERAGFISGMFLCGYAIFRASVEFFREPDIQLGLLLGGATMGQLLCIPMFIVGAVIVARSKKPLA